MLCREQRRAGEGNCPQKSRDFIRRHLRENKLALAGRPTGYGREGQSHGTVSHAHNHKVGHRTGHACNVARNGCKRSEAKLELGERTSSLDPPFPQSPLNARPGLPRDLALGIVPLRRRCEHLEQ